MNSVPSSLAKPAHLLSTRISEHHITKCPVGNHLVECCGTAHNVEWEIVDACCGVGKLLTIEAN